MQFKVVPRPPDSLAAVADARRAIPRVPGSIEDCCARLVARTDIRSRDDAREWLTFLRALGLVAESERGFYRTGDEFDPDDCLTDRESTTTSVAAAFRTRVYLADAILETLRVADKPLDADGVFERVREDVPRWERDHHADWEQVWRERVWRILEWAVLFTLAGHDTDGYRAI